MARVLPFWGKALGPGRCVKTKENCACILKMECRIRDQAKINKYYTKTLSMSGNR